MAKWNPVVEEWARKAESEWRIVLILAKEANTEDALIFHAQQCAEKYIKAALVACGEAPTKTHDISALYRILKTHITDLILEESALDRLSQGGVSFRYPGCDATSDDANLAFKQAELNRAALQQWLRLLGGNR